MRIDSDTAFLVVDDSTSILSIITKMLNNLGYENITTSVNGKKAFLTLEEKHGAHDEIECIISDWNMPEMDGLEFLKKVRSDDRFKDLVFIMLTSESGKDDVLTAIEEGVDNYILKPVSANNIKDKIDRINKKEG